DCLFDSRLGSCRRKLDGPEIVRTCPHTADKLGTASFDAAEHVPYTLPPMAAIMGAAATAEVFTAMEIMAAAKLMVFDTAVIVAPTAAPAETKGRAIVRSRRVVITRCVVRIDVRIKVRVRVDRSRVGVDRRADSDSESHRSLGRRAGQNQHHYQRHHRKGYFL